MELLLGFGGVRLRQASRIADKRSVQRYHRAVHERRGGGARTTAAAARV